MKRILAIILIGIVGVSFSIPTEIADMGKKRKFKLNNRAKYPAGFNLYGFGPAGKVGISFDYFVVPKFSLEVGAGVRRFNSAVEDMDHSFFVGGRYHFFGNTPLNITPYVGVFSGFEYTGSDVQNFNLYVPVGLQRVKRNRISWSIEVAYQRNVYDPGNSIYGGGKVGFRF